jgi:RNA-directed DNA polymerase
MSATAQQPAYEWQDLPWRKLEAQVFKLQRRIFNASQRGDTKTVHRLERLLMHSWAAKCLAVRKVTQDNRGKKTAGVDGVRNLAPTQRLQLTSDLRPQATPHPVRRVWIPKPGKTEKRPLGIPTIRDRAAQTLVRLALEPEWEARFEPRSYGFRPGRSVHDACEAIFNAINVKPKFVLDADIAACFDRIDHTALLHKLHTFPALRRTITRWLNAGVWDGVEFKPTEAGTPQGGALSPLLANIALHGLETHLRTAFPSEVTVNGHRRQGWHPIVVRYADDFVVLHQDRSVIERARQLAAEWLAQIGLELKPEKTRIGHTLDACDGQPAGFDFLGFSVRQYPVGHHRSKTDHHGHRLGFKTFIKPSKQAQKRHLQATRAVAKKMRGAPQSALVRALNPKILGWANFYAASVAKEVFSRMDHLVLRQLWAWARRRHSRRGGKWLHARYWHTAGGRNWSFQARDGVALATHASTPIRRHLMVRDDARYYDANLLYWVTRLGRHPEMPKGKATLLKRQQGRCAWCGRLFTPLDDQLEIDHVVPRSLGGSDAYTNLQLLHGHCHDQKTARDDSLMVANQREALSAKETSIKEPCELKSSRTVLKSGGEG